jgi:hypothetical protein
VQQSWSRLIVGGAIGLIFVVGGAVMLGAAAKAEQSQQLAQHQAQQYAHWQAQQQAQQYAEWQAQQALLPPPPPAPPRAQ